MKVEWNFDVRVTPVIALSGAGATGKTTTFNALSSLLNEAGLPYIFTGSITREYYAAMNVGSEAAFKAMTIEQRRNFQFGIIPYFIDKLKRTKENYPNHAILSERAIFDHLAYTIKSSDVTLDEYYAFDSYIREFVDMTRYVFTFPYPVSFSNNVEDDNFRSATVSDNIILDALMKATIRDKSKHIVSVGGGLKVVSLETTNNRKYYFNWFTVPDDELSVRANYIFNTITYDREHSIYRDHNID